MALNLLQIGQIHPIAEETNHGTVLSLIQSEDGKFTHAGGKKAIGESWRGAALEMAEDGQADFLVQLIFSCIQKAIHKILARTGALSYDHHAVVVAAKTAASQVFNDLVHVVSELWNHSDLRA